MGHKEYAGENHGPGLLEPLGEPCGWKVGAYEPSPSGIHGDIEYLYVVDLAKKEIRCYSTRQLHRDTEGDPTFDPSNEPGAPFLTINASNIDKEVAENE